jgi:hypothetical protein
VPPFIGNLPESRGLHDPLEQPAIADSKTNGILAAAPPECNPGKHPGGVPASPAGGSVSCT